MRAMDAFCFPVRRACDDGLPIAMLTGKHIICIPSNSPRTGTHFSCYFSSKIPSSPE